MIIEIPSRWGVITGRKEIPTIGELVRKTLEDQKLNHPKTYPRDEYSARHLLADSIATIPASQFSEMDWVNYVGHNPGRKLYNERRVLKKAIGLAKTLPWVLSDWLEIPRLKLHRWHVSSSAGREITQAEFDKLWRHIEALAPRRKTKWQLVILLGALCGMRRCEIAGLRRSQIDLPAKEIHFEIGSTKDGSPRITPIPALALELIRLRLEFCSEYLFPHAVIPNRPMRGDSLYNRWRALLRTAGVRHARFHDLRHTCITRLVRSNLFSLEDISKGYGVSPPVIRRVYHHTNSETRRKMADYLNGI